MALAAIPGEITRHLKTALVLSQREVLLRVLDEAEVMLKAGQPLTAAILAGVVLEEALRLSNSGIFNENDQNRIKTWRKMRSQALHASSTVSNLNVVQIKAMLTGIRTILDLSSRPQNTSTPSMQMDDTLTKTRGKYAFVQTSVDEFLKRKREDLELEGSK